MPWMMARSLDLFLESVSQPGKGHEWLDLCLWIVRLLVGRGTSWKE